MCSDPEVKTLHVFTWTIENFRACPQKNGFCLDSPVFMAESLEKTTWFVKLYPTGNTISKGHMSCFLYRSINSAGPSEVEFDFTIEAIDRNKKCLAKKECVYKFMKGMNYGEPRFLKLDLNLISDCEDFTIEVGMKKISSGFTTRNICYTKIVTDHFSFKWNVKNSISPDGDIKPISFYDTLLFEIIIEKPEDDINISLQKKQGFDEVHNLICRVALLDLKGNIADSKESIFQSHDPDENGPWNFPTFLKRSKILAEKDKYIDDDCFTLKFDFDISSGKTQHSLKDIECKPLDNLLKVKEGHFASLKKDLKYMLTNHVHADVELRAGDEVIRAHKAILCSRSPVFLAMFNQDMTENLNGVIIISDVQAETLSSLLDYMYTGDCDALDYESYMKLLLAAEKYQVLSLKEKCASSLESLMSDENVCDILFTADLIQQESLRVCSVNHIKQKYKTIFKSDKWKQLAIRNFELATEIFCEVSHNLSI